MLQSLKLVLLLILVGLSSCSIARHGGVRTVPARIEWPRPEPTGRYDRSRYDVTYSLHNHKHPNKAHHVRRLTNSGGILVGYPQPGQVPLTSYKIPLPGLAPSRGLVPTHRLVTSLADANYKTPWSLYPYLLPQSGRFNRNSSGWLKRPGLEPQSTGFLESFNRMPLSTQGIHTPDPSLTTKNQLTWTSIK